MSRTISDAFRTAIYAQHTGESLAVFITFNLVLADNSTETRRIVNQPGGLTKGGEDYDYHPMGIKLPSSAPGQTPKARLSIDNVDRTLVTALRTAVSYTVDIELGLASDPETVEVGFYGIDAGGLNWEIPTAVVDLVRQDARREPFPAPAFTPTNAPGAH